MPARKKDTANFRQEFLNALKEHKTVSELCARFSISRKTFYKWKKVSEQENHTNSRKQGRKTTIDDRIISMVKDLIVANPTWSVDKIYSYLCSANNGEQLVSRHWIQNQLQKNNLSTANKRYIFSYRSTPTQQIVPEIRPQQVIQPVIEDQQIFHAGNSSPPDFYAFTRSIYNNLDLQYKKLASLVSPYLSPNIKLQLKNAALLVVQNPYKAAFTIIIAVTNAYLMSIVGNAILNAEGAGQKIGMAFSSLALFCGVFFLLYSCKYYITIALVIIKSRTSQSKKVNSSNELVKSLGSFVNEKIIQRITATHTNPVEIHKQAIAETVTEFPFFSVQIPLFNEKKVANRVVAAAVAMNYPNFEVIVCDDSTDETTQLLKEKWGNHPKVRILHREQRTGFKGAALDNALKFMSAQADYVVVFDADFVPYPDTLHLFAKYFQVMNKNERDNTSRASGVVASEVVNSNSITNGLTHNAEAANYYNKTVAIQGYQWHVLNKSENWITRAVRTEFAGSYIVERSGTQLFSLLKQIAGSVYAINATVLKDVGWGTSITEDFQLTLKLYEQGYKVAYTPYIQAPSECVSTLKRLIRQRQRWAEGHSHNIKLHIKDLLASPHMSTKEKWESIYLAPYYLQSLIFLVGTAAWIIAEVVLKVKLPFWTSALGWSLVLTNLFSLPLMNIIGLFLEEGEERDYLGIFSFVTLCYILAPFIGWAALKGFVEKEEGPWFRTPKSGRITDNVARSAEKKESRITKFIPWLRPALGTLRKIIPSTSININPSPYLAYATAGNTFTSNWSVRSGRIKKRVVHTIVLFLTGITALTNVLQATVPQAFANPDTYYMRSSADNLAADNLTNSSTDIRAAGSTTIGANTQVQTMSATNPTFYMLTDNLNKRWSSDIAITDINRSLAGHWKIDECRDSTIYDNSGNSNNGTITPGGSGNTSAGTCTSGTSTEMWNNGAEGKFNASLDFDGSNDYAYMTTAAPLQGGTALTLSAWVKPATLTGNHSPVGFFGSASDKGYWFNLPSSGEPQFWISRDGSGQDNAVGSIGQVTTGVWTHMVGTYDGTTMKIYINGVQAGSAAQSGTIHTVTTADAFAIGRLGALSSDYFDGQVDEVRVYNRVLSSSDIQSLYQAERRNVQIATHTDGSTVAVWEDSRMSTPSTQDRFDNARGNVTIARQNASIAPTDNGKILVTGGIDEAGTFRSSSEIYDPTSNTFTLALNHLPGLRANMEAVTLDDSRILLIGGRSATNTVLSTAALFNGQTNTSAATGALTAARTDGPAIKLHNGSVLRIGGCSAYSGGACSTRVSAAELFDPGRARWAAVGSLVSGSRSNSRAALLPNGEVMAIGGYDGSNRLSTSEIYDPVTATWRRGPSMAVAREEPGVTSLPDGSVLVVGGYDGSNYLSSSELYDSYSQAWTTLNAVHSNLAGTYKNNGLVQLGNGKVLIAGATEATNNGSSTAMVYEPLTKSFTLTNSLMQTRRENVTPVLVQNGKVLFAGGQQGTAAISNAELYTPVTYDIYTQKYDVSGAKQWGSGADIRVNSDAGNRLSSSGPPNYNHLNPSVSLDTSGNAIIAWEEQRNSPFNSEVWSQKLASSDGAKQWPLGTQNAFAAAPGALTYNRQTDQDSPGVTANLLANGKTLVIGTETNNVGRSMSELYDPVANTFTVGPRMARPRFGHTSTNLLDGRVLAAGSEVSAAIGSTAELFNPVTTTWALTTNNMSVSRNAHTAAVMKDGRVLIAGGRTPGTSTDLSTAQIFNPATNTFAAAANMPVARSSMSSVTLPNGKVLVVGDQADDAQSTSAILYDPLANTWAAVPGAHQSRTWSDILLLNNGKVLSIGPPGGGTASTSEIYDPYLNTWTLSAVMAKVREAPGILTLLPDGRVLTHGGWNSVDGNLSSAEIYDPAANTWSTTSTDLRRASVITPSTYNPIDNKILILGGESSGATTADLFTPSSDMPVSAYQHQAYEVYKGAQKDRGFLNGIQQRKPQVAIDSDGNSVIVWQEQEQMMKEFQGTAHTNDANAYRKFGTKPRIVDQCASSDGCGSQPMVISLPIQVVGQKVCNAGSGCDAGTTTGERQWATEQEVINKNNPNNITVNTIKDVQNPSAVNDGTNIIVTYQSDADVNNTSNKTSKIFAQKLDTNGKLVWSTPWSASTGNMTTNRRDAKASVIDSGRVLITGGQNSAVLSSAEVFNLKTGLGTAATNNMVEARMYHQSTLLSNRQTLITGGGTSSSTSTTTAQLFTASGESGSFASTTGGMTTSRAEHTATALRDGRVIIAGGRNTTTMLSSSELYTTNTSTFAASGNFRTGLRRNHEATLMKGGQVLIAGGTNGTGPVSSAEFYDPATSAWTAASVLATKRQDFTLTPLNDGRVLAVGGSDGTNRLSTAEIYTPDVNSWTTTGSLIGGLRSDHTAVLLPSGQIVVHGGTTNGTDELTTAELYDPTTGTWTVFAGTGTARKNHTMVTLNNGQTAVFGGWDDSTTYSSAEIFSIDQKVSNNDSTHSLKPDLVKDSSGHFQIVWQAWRAEGLSPGNGGNSWKIAEQKINNPSSGSVTKMLPTGTPNSFASGGGLNNLRTFGSAATLPSGKVLITAGLDSDGGIYYSSAEIYDPQAGTWSLTDNLRTGERANAGTVTLENGQVLFYGGIDGSAAYHSTSELYNPATQTWTQTTGSLRLGGRSEALTAILSTGTVLTASGRSGVATVLSTSELYNPTTQTWTQTTGSLRLGSRLGPGLVTLANEQVLIMGGYDGSVRLSTSELYNPTTQTWTQTTGSLTTGLRQRPHAIKLNNNKVLITGGSAGPGSVLSTSEIYDPSSQTWTATGSLTYGGRDYANITLLPSGKVMLTGGQDDVVGVLSTSELYDPTTGTWTAGPNLATGSRTYANSVLLKTGKMLIIGGDSDASLGYTTTELFTPELSEKLISSDDSSRSYNQTDPRIASDSANAVSYVTWSDDRLTSPSDTTRESNIYMQKVNSDGNPVWPNGLGENGSYNVRDVRVDNTRGALNTSVQTKPVISKRTYTNAADDIALQLAWNDTREGAPAINIYGQSYNTMNRSMTSTSWTAYFILNNLASGDTLNVQVGATEADGETTAFESTNGTFDGGVDSTDGEKSIVFSNLPQYGEESLTHKRLFMKFTRTGGTFDLRYNGAHNASGTVDADTRLDVGIVVPERTALLAMLIPILPLIAKGIQIRRRRKEFAIQRSK